MVRKLMVLELNEELKWYSQCMLWTRLGSFRVAMAVATVL